MADYPIYGTIANINAFAMGAKMINPRAMIHLEWSRINHWSGRHLSDNGGGPASFPVRI